MIDLQRPRLLQFQMDIAQSIPCVPEEARTELLRMILPDSLRIFINWRDQFVPTRPRKVQMSERFLSDPLTIRHRPAVEELKARIESGEDLTPFLSKDIAQYGYAPRPKGNHRKRRGINWDERDHALNTYDTHHLHLHRSRRADELLFVSFARDIASFIMVGDHRSWKDGTIANAVAQERAAAGGELKGILGSRSEEYTPEQRNELQWRALSTAIRVGDKVVPSAFICRDGTGISQSRYVDQMISDMAKHDPLLDDEAYVSELFESAGRTSPLAPQFVWLMRDCDLCVGEKSSLTGFPRLMWRR
jgi:hypothetical protein